ncbi:oxidoreductase [Actinoalloteichus sp. AHMU CJ021]|uniref:NAD(P)/FAD-dependent oxidoreductase n=1 Tax=Actinoalloteichus TaxID=65496 RepID=UPI0004AAC19F|nr:FAD-dependent oxidoreductase [Actinoalloteichus caeruleus]AUS78826.1 oxidoreductase [Actinoalloteichus sp. AHMU CJ021]
MTHHIVVLGAGYAGLTAARRAARLLRGSDVRLTLVNRSERFVERVRLHQLAARGIPPGQSLFRALAGSGVEFVVGEVAEVDAEARAVTLVDGRGSLTYDSLVYALGSAADLDAVPGLREHGFAVADAEGAGRLRARLDELPGGAVVVVVGAGPTGVEVAAELAEARPDLSVELVTRSELGGGLSPGARRHLRRTFARLGVGVREHQRVTAVERDGVVTAEGARLACTALVWAGGFRVPSPAARSALRTDERGRLVVDGRLRSVSHPEVYGVGDSASAATVTGGETRMSCQAALPMGRYVAVDLARTLRGRRSGRPARIRDLGLDVALGRRNAVVQLFRGGGRPVGAVLTGRPAAWIKHRVVRAAAWLAGA